MAKDRLGFRSRSAAFRRISAQTRGGEARNSGFRSKVPVWCRPKWLDVNSVTDVTDV
jgi:hypothetical protein